MGLNFGISGTLFNTNFSISLSAAVDHNGKAQLTLTPEVGASSEKVAAGGFARLMVGGENTTVDSLDGTGVSTSLSAGPVSLSASAPGMQSDGSGLVPEGMVDGFDTKNAVFEAGISAGTKGAELTGTVGHGVSIETTALGDAGRAIGSRLYDLVNKE